MSDTRKPTQGSQGVAGKLGVLTAIILALTELGHAIRPAIPSVSKYACKVSSDLPWCFSAKNLVGDYQVVLGKGGGCNGGAGNSRPSQLARIEFRDKLIATNECGMTSEVRITRVRTHNQ